MSKDLGEEPLVHEGARVTNSTLGRYTEVGPGSILLNTTLGDYSYTTRFCDLANTSVGKFSNIAAFSRIGPTDHPLDRASLHHFMYRSADYWPDAEHDAAFFAHRESRRTTIGHDTWIGHGAIIKPEVTRGPRRGGRRRGRGDQGCRALHDRRRLPRQTAARPPAAGHRRAADRAGVVGLGPRPLRAALEDFRALKAEAFLEKLRNRRRVLNGVEKSAN
jgi:hypothetical protein